MSIGDLESEPVNMHQALGVLGGVCASYIGGMQPASVALGTDEEKRAYQQMAVAILIHQIVSLSHHPATMAKILRLVADEMDAKAAQQQPFDADTTDETPGGGAPSPQFHTPDASE